MFNRKGGKAKNSTAIIVTSVVVVGVIAAILVWRLSISPTGEAVGGTCKWVPAYFNPVGDPIVIGTGCTLTDTENYDPFVGGSILTSLGTYKDICADASFLNEYWCDLSTGNGMLTYGYCTAGCTGGTIGGLTTDEALTAPGKCVSKIRVCSSGSAELK